MKIWKRVIAVSLTIWCGFFVGCINKETQVQRGDVSQILYLGNGAEPESLDPHIVTGLTEYAVMASLFEGLVGEDPDDLSPEPGSAKKWDISEDGKTYTFFIRKGAKWSNGDRLTAHDFAYSFERILNPILGAEYAYMLYPLKNAQQYNKGEIKSFAKVGARAINDYELILELENQTPYFLSLLTHFAWWPVNKTVIEKFKTNDVRSTPWTREQNIVTNGPFTLKEWRVNKHIIVEKDPQYWDAETVRLKQIHFYPITDLKTEESDFRAGRLHVTSSVPVHDIENYKKNKPKKIKIHSSLSTYYYLLNTDRKPLDDVRVRKALAYSVNREEITKYVTKGGEEPAYHFTPPGTNGYTSKKLFKYDLEKAKKLLAEAGYPNGKGFPELEILYSTKDFHRSIAEVIQQMWFKNLNIKVNLLNQEWKVYLDTRANQNYDIGRAGWVGDYNDPNTFLDLWVKDGGNNHTGWNHPRYDELITLASQTKDRETRFSYFQEAETLLMDEMPAIPLHFSVSKFLIQKSVKGWSSNILNHHPYKYVYLDSVVEKSLEN